MQEYAERRQRLLYELPNNSLVILAGAKPKTRNSDVHYSFRQDSDFYYLTGFVEPQAWTVLVKDSKGAGRFLLFCLPLDELAETWHGRRVGSARAISEYGADEAYDLDMLEDTVRELLQDTVQVYCHLRANPKARTKILDWIGRTKLVESLNDIAPVLHELRLFKSRSELENMRTAASISAQAHNLLISSTKVGDYEYQLEAKFNAYCLEHGCRRMAYDSIVASGANAMILHYVENSSKISKDQLVLVDAGAEYNYYASDITRTFPASGKFNARQRQIYNMVLEAQMAAIELIKPGITWSSIQQAILNILEPAIATLKLDGNCKDYYMHSPGHWLGLDVHDAGSYKVQQVERVLSPGMVLTIEPGLYIKQLGIGIRIEDNILVTNTGAEVLSAEAVKTVSEIENLRI